MKRNRLLSWLILLALTLTACGNAAASWQEQYDLGLRYIGENNYEQALIAFKAAIEIDPKRAEAYIGAADAYVGLGQIENADAILKQGYEQTKQESLLLYIVVVHTKAGMGIIMPDLTSVPGGIAANILSALGMDVFYQYEPVNNTENNTVLYTDPQAGAVVQKGDIVFLHISGDFTVSSFEIKLFVGDSFKLTASGADGTYAWASTQPGVVSVSADGTITALSEGSADVFVTSGEMELKCRVEVEECSLELSLPTTAFVSGEATQIEVEGVPESATVTWTSSDSDVISVDGDGNISVIPKRTTSTATAIITASYDYNGSTYTESIELTVEYPYPEAEIHSETMSIGQTAQITVVTHPENCSVRYESSNTQVISIDENGTVTALKGGDAYVIVYMAYDTPLTPGEYHDVWNGVQINAAENEYWALVHVSVSHPVQQQQQQQRTDPAPETNREGEEAGGNETGMYFDPEDLQSGTGYTIIYIDENGNPQTVGYIPPGSDYVQPGQYDTLPDGINHIPSDGGYGGRDYYG